MAAVDSSAWTGVKADDDSQPAMPTGSPQVCGEFHSQEKFEAAMQRLEGSTFQHADFSLRVPGREDVRLDSTKEEPLREDEARNLRTLGVSTASVSAAFAAAGLVVATGGAALPAVAAAAAAGGATAAAGEAVGQAAAPGGKPPQAQAAETTGVILMVHAPTPERRELAERVLKEEGATRVWREPEAAG